MYRLRIVLAVTSAFIIQPSANAQTPHVTPDVSGSPAANNTVVVPPPDGSAKSPPAPSEFKILVPDGFGGLKELSATSDGAPDQTGSTTGVPSPNDDGNP